MQTSIGDSLGLREAGPTQAVVAMVRAAHHPLSGMRKAAKGNLPLTAIISPAAGVAGHPSSPPRSRCAHRCGASISRVCPFHDDGAPCATTQTRRAPVRKKTPAGRDGAGIQVRPGAPGLQGGPKGCRVGAKTGTRAPARGPSPDQAKPEAMSIKVQPEPGKNLGQGGPKRRLACHGEICGMGFETRPSLGPPTAERPTNRLCQ